MAELSGRLGAAGAMIPPDPGLLSAYGMLAAPVTKEASRTVLIPHDDAACDTQLGEVFAELAETATARMAEEGYGRASLTVEHWVDARYLGQSYELPVAADDWVERFHRAHAKRYGYRQDDARVEAVTLRVATRAPGLSLDPPALEPATEGDPARAVGPSAQRRPAPGRRLLVAARPARRSLPAGSGPRPGVQFDHLDSIRLARRSGRTGEHGAAAGRLIRQRPIGVCAAIPGVAARSTGPAICRTPRPSVPGDLSCRPTLTRVMVSRSKFRA